LGFCFLPVGRTDMHVLTPNWERSDLTEL